MQGTGMSRRNSPPKIDTFLLLLKYRFQLSSTNTTCSAELQFSAILLPFAINLLPHNLFELYAYLLEIGGRRNFDLVAERYCRLGTDSKELVHVIPT